MRTCVREDGGTSARQGIAPMRRALDQGDRRSSRRVRQLREPLGARYCADARATRSARAAQSDPQRPALAAARATPHAAARSGSRRRRTAAAARAPATRFTPRDACSTGPRERSARNRVMLANADADLLARRSSASCAAATASRTTARAVGQLLRRQRSDGAEIEQWWLARLELPVTCLRTAVVNRPSSASRRLKGNILPYGTGARTRELDLRGPEHLRRDPGVRRHRPPGVAGSVRRWAAWDSNPEPRD